NMTEYIKNCCRTFMSKKNEPEIQSKSLSPLPPHELIKVRPPGKLTAESNVKKNVGVSEDYLLSKLPPDGREVPFIIPTFKPSYIQPRGSQYSGYNIGQQSKQYDLSIIYKTFLCVCMVVCVCIESITLSGDERDFEPGKVCVHLKYEEAVEQVWITLCMDLSVYSDGVEVQKIGVKGVLTMTKPVRFKSTVKEASADTVFMETFVFTLNLEQIRRSALVLRLQAHTPRKRTLGECVLSLRTLGPEATKHCLEFKPYSKTHVCHAELQLALCFQPVNSRMQLQILSAQNLPSSSSPLTQSFFVKVELLSEARVLLKRKTKVMKSSGGQIQWAEVLHLPITNLDQNLQLAVKLYSRSSVRRKHLLGQVSSDSPEAVEQWRDSMANPEKVVTSWHRLSRL
uniref:Tandem C2 domains, nuclear n=2 Tax=Cyprinus carpio TaxID=7962 RepID=A0A9R1SFI7_CYPCA